MARQYFLPQGFYVTGREMLDAGLRVHETMEGYNFVAETVEQVVQRAQQVKNRMERLEADGKAAQAEGDDYTSRSCREQYDDCKRVLGIWRRRWRDLEAHEAADQQKIYEAEAYAEGAWLRHAERYDPEAQHDLELHNALAEAH